MRKVYLIILFLAYFVNVNAQNGWQSYSIPSPGGGGFHFMNESTGIVVGQHKYYRTTNGMASWNIYNTPDTASSTHYGSVIFINELTGWLRGVSIGVQFPFILCIERLTQVKLLGR